LEEQRRQREEEKAREEAERQAREEAQRLEEKRQEGLDVREYILTKHVDIRELSEEDVLEGDIIRVVVADDTLDPDIKEIAVDVGFRIKEDLERTPQEVIVYREENPDVAVARARYDSALDQYVLVE
jgi:hypothetical protein